MKNLVIVGATLGLAMMSSAAIAGQNWWAPVHIDRWASHTDAYGSIGAARNSTDNKQGIGCSITATKEYTSAECWARDKDGEYVTCYNRVKSGMRQAVMSIDAMSYIHFRTDSEDTTKCSVIDVSTASIHTPPEP